MIKCKEYLLYNSNYGNDKIIYNTEKESVTIGGTNKKGDYIRIDIPLESFQNVQDELKDILEKLETSEEYDASVYSKGEKYFEDFLPNEKLRSNKLILKKLTQRVYSSILLNSKLKYEDKCIKTEVDVMFDFEEELEEVLPFLYHPSDKTLNLIQYDLLSILENIGCRVVNGEFGRGRESSRYSSKLWIRISTHKIPNIRFSSN